MRLLGYALFLLSLCQCLSPLKAPAASIQSEDSSRSIALRGTPSVGERRVALVIGIGAYQDAPLKNPVHDAEAMARVLRDNGFEVTLLKNIDRRRMFASVKEFGKKLKKSEVALFYFAGHGVQVDSANYLVPSDLIGNELQDADDLRYSAFPLNELMDRMRESSTNNIIILDACRDNPFLSRLSRSASRGLAKVVTPATTSILYSTDPGNTASDGAGGTNGVFTSRLIEFIQKDGLELVDVMREVAINVARDTNGLQHPVFDGVLSSKFYFRAPLEQKPPEPASSAGAVDAKQLELRYWESAEKAGTPSAYQAYLKKFPSGDFVDLARGRLEQPSQDTFKAERARYEKEKAALESKVQEAAERARLTKENAELERRVRQAELDARQAKELAESKAREVERERLAKENAELERRVREAEAGARQREAELQKRQQDAEAKKKLEDAQKKQQEIEAKKKQEEDASRQQSSFSLPGYGR